MKEIKKKIAELVALNGMDDYSKFDERYKKQEKLFEELTALARKNKTLLGRILKYGVADGQAAYVISKVNQKTVRLQWIDYVDGYNAFGIHNIEINIPMKEAFALCNFDDFMDGLRK